MSNRTFDGNSCSFEKFSHKKGKSKHRSTKQNRRDKQDQLQGQIVTHTIRRGQGTISSRKPGLQLAIDVAVEKLWHWLGRRNSKSAIRRAFKELMDNKIFRWVEDQQHFQLMAR